MRNSVLRRYVVVVLHIILLNHIILSGRFLSFFLPLLYWNPIVVGVVGVVVGEHAGSL